MLGDASIEERDVLRDELKHGYSKDVLSLNVLLDKNLDSLVKLNNGIDSAASRRFESHTEVIGQLDWLIDTHQRNIERIKETLKVYS